jgi:hypothetical protein
MRGGLRRGGIRGYPAARCHVGRLRLLLRQGRQGPYVPLVEWADRWMLMGGCELSASGFTRASAGAPTLSSS